MLYVTDNGDIIVSTKYLCELFDVTKQTISKWHKNGCPKLDTGKWNLGEVIPWYFARLDAGPDNPATRDLRQRQLIATTEYREEKAKRAKLEREDIENKYLPKDKVGKAWQARVEELTRGMNSFKKRLVPLIAGQPEIEIQKILEDEVYDLLNQYYQYDKYTPVENR